LPLRLYDFAVTQAFAEKAYPIAAVPQELHLVAAAAAKEENMTRVRIRMRCRLYRRTQANHPLAKISESGRQIRSGIAAEICRLGPNGGNLRTRNGNNRARRIVLLAPDAALICSVRHRFKTLT
jgi:hypothetical protein